MNRLPDPKEGKAAELNLTAELHSQLTSVQDEMKNVMENVKILLEERDNRQHSFDVSSLYFFF